MSHKFNLHISDEFKFSKMQAKIIEKELKKLPDMKPNTLKINPIYLYKHEDCYEACVIIRSTVKLPVNLTNIPIALTSKGEVKSKIQPDLNKLGLIKDHEAIPIILKFPMTEELAKETIRGYSIIFLDNIKAIETSKPSLKKVDNFFNDFERKVIEEYVEKTSPLEKDTFTIEAGNLFEREDKGIIPMYIFNTTSKPRELNNIELVMTPQGIGAARLVKMIDKLQGEENGVTVVPIEITKKDTPATLEELRNCKITISLKDQQ